MRIIKNGFLIAVCLLLNACGQINYDVLIPDETEYYFIDDEIRVTPPLIPSRETIERAHTVEFVAAHYNWTANGMWSVVHIENEMENKFYTLPWMNTKPMLDFVHDEYSSFGFYFDQIISDRTLRIRDMSAHELILRADNGNESAMMIMTTMRADDGHIVLVNLLYPLYNRARHNAEGLNSGAETLDAMRDVIAQYRAFRSSVVILSQEDKKYHAMVLN